MKNSKTRIIFLSFTILLIVGLIFWFSRLLIGVKIGAIKTIEGVVQSYDKNEGFISVNTKYYGQVNFYSLSENYLSTFFLEDAVLNKTSKKKYYPSVLVKISDNISGKLGNKKIYFTGLTVKEDRKIYFENLIFADRK